MTSCELKTLIMAWLATNDGWEEPISEIEIKIAKVYGPQRRRLRARWEPGLAQDLLNWYSPSWYERYKQIHPKVQDYLGNDKS